MTQLITQLLKQITWIDRNIKIPREYAMKPDYPSEFQQYFGTTPFASLKFDKILYRNKFKSFVKYLMDLDFVPVQMGTSSFKLVNFHRNILIVGEIADIIKEESEEEEEQGYAVNNNEEVFVSFYPTMENKGFVTELIKKVDSKFLREELIVRNKFFMVAQNQRGLYSQRTTFKAIPIKDDRYDLFYGKKFPHEDFKKFITDETEHLMLFYGEPGTGKSNYLKNLIINSRKNVIYIPPGMLRVISSPDFVSYVMENKNSILIVEDAEDVLSIDRNAATTNLLQICDGFLRDCLNLKVLATFNAPISKIDPALLRKGRLYMSHEFVKLTPSESNKLADFCGINYNFTEDSSLAEIFNVKKSTSALSKPTTAIGFGNF